MLYLVCRCFFLFIGCGPAIVVEPGRIATLSPAQICGTGARASPDSFDYIGIQFPVPLAPSILGHYKYRTATSSKVRLPRAVVHFEKSKGQQKILHLRSITEWQSCPNLYEKPHLYVKIRLCTTTSQYGKRGADEKRKLGGKRNLYEKTRLSNKIRSQKKTFL